MRCITLVLAWLVAGCGGLPYTPTVRYVISPDVHLVKAERTERSLGIRPLEPTRRHKQAIAYRVGDYELRYYDSAEWAEAPRAMVTRALMDAIIATGRFQDVGYAADLASPDLILTGELRAFDEVRTENTWLAECEIRLELRQGLQRQAVWTATLSASQPLEEHTLPALAAAMSQAVAQVVQEAATEIAQH